MNFPRCDLPAFGNHKIKSLNMDYSFVDSTKPYSIDVL
jgi:hypothetical protein